MNPDSQASAADSASAYGYGETLYQPALAAAKTEQAVIAQVAGEVATRLAAGGRLYTFGAGHSWAFAAELCSRAGGLRPVTAMSLEDLRSTPRLAYLQLTDSMPERDPDNGPALLALHHVTSRDALLIASQSGRNGASIAMAEHARRAGTYTAAVVSRAHCAAFPSRHPDGHKLPDVVDHVIDNHCPVGDAAVAVSPVERMGGTSTISFTLIAQLLSIAVADDLRRRGQPPAVILSANIDVTKQ